MQVRLHQANQKELVKQYTKNLLSGFYGGSYLELIAEFEKELLQGALLKYNYNISEISRRLHINRGTLRSKLKRHGLYRKTYSGKAYVKKEIQREIKKEEEANVEIA